MGAGLRLGYMVCPPTFVSAARAIKTMLDHGRAWLEQAAMADFIESGRFDEHIQQLRAVYEKQCNAAAAALVALAPGSSIRGADGGMHLSWSLPADCAFAGQLQRRLLGDGVGVYTLRDGPACSLPDDPLLDCLVLVGYACVDERTAAFGFRKIAENLAALRA